MRKTTECRQRDSRWETEPERLRLPPPAACVADSRQRGRDSCQVYAPKTLPLLQTAQRVRPSYGAHRAGSIDAVRSWTFLARKFSPRQLSQDLQPDYLTSHLLHCKGILMVKKPLCLREEIHQNKPFASPAQEALLALSRTTDVLQRRFAQLVEPYGISLQQYNVLRILRGAGQEGTPT